MRILSCVAAACAAIATFATVNIAAPTAAHAAKVCKPGKIVATSRPFITRSTGAFPASLIAWNRKARRRHGARFAFWNRAEQKRVTCNQIRVGAQRRWQCTRVARPCAGFGKLQPLPRCAGRHVTTGPRRSTRGSARQFARAQWRREVRNKFGSDYRRWAVARGKSMTCTVRNGRHRCRAAARACRR